MDATEPYPGVPSLLDWLKKAGYQTAIVSNKADFAVKKLNRIYFEGMIPVAIGEREGIRKKPAPDTVFQALRELGVEAQHAVYVGDSDVDLETAANAGMDVIPVCWGFRSREFLIEHGAVSERIVSNVRELREQITAKQIVAPFLLPKRRKRYGRIKGFGNECGHWLDACGSGSRVFHAGRICDG